MLQALRLYATLFLRKSRRMNEKSCCFIGHRDINVTDELIKKITDEVIKLINSGVNKFLFGSRSDFNSLCHGIVTKIQKEYKNIVRIAYDTKHESSVYESDRERLEKTYSAITHKDIKLFGYEIIKCPEKIFNGGKASYIERNQIMIDESDYCMFYFDKKYTPKNGRSGTAIAYKYAVRKNKKIINVF